MSTMENVQLLFTFIGGLGMFLYGMNVMADGLQKSAGDKMKRLLQFLTNNRFCRRAGGPRRDGHHPELVGHHGDGRGFCQRGDYDPRAGGRRDHWEQTSEPR